MQRFTFVFALSLLGSIVGCETPPPPVLDDAGTDAPRQDAGVATCETADDCDDGTFCNGVERCAPTDADADERGCAPADAEACMPSQECDEAGDACLTMCDVERDADGDGVDAEACGGIDCDDADGNRYPGNTERCDADDHDEDCDPETFGFRDGDMDARGDARCCNTDEDTGDAICGPDCDDSRPDIFPGQLEACDGSDNDCDGTMDEGVLRTFYADLDDDGYGDESAPTMMGCVPGPTQTEMDGDCDDTTSSVSPVSPEICDVAMVDENCDGTPNPASLCMCEGDISRPCSLPGRCASGTERCVAGSWGACSIAAVTEICNAEDDDCDGRADESLTVTCYGDGDDDGYPNASATPSDVCPIAERTTVGGCPFGSTNRVPLGAAIDCNDMAFDVRPGATELCDASMVDENCDGMANPNPPCACSGSETRPCSMPGRCSAGIETCAGGVWGACSILAQAETCNGVDDDCDGTVDDGVTITCFPDGDDDTYSPGGASMAVCAQPGRGAVGGCPVGLTNRMPAGAIDCNDGRPDVYPGAAEICDAAMVDESCDGMANPNPPCACSGSMTRPCPQPGRCGTGIQTCAAGAWGSCSISPETESCNAINDDCDAATDEGTTVACYTDSDNDTYSPGGAVMNVCPVPGRAMVGGCPVGLTNRVAGAGTTDCNDASSAIYPGAAESCSGSADDDCDGMVNEGCMCTVGMMRPCMLPGQCATGTETCQLPGPAWVCSVSPTAESCNMVDDDCDGTVDDGVQIQCWVDMDGDTYAPMGASSIFACSCPAGTTNRNPATAAAQDCNDGNAARFPGAPEVCNVADDDCDGMIDDGLPLVTVYFDTDGDAHAGAPMMRCAGYPGSEPSSQDCNESNPSVYVGATEVCDRTDNNCSSGGGVDAAEDMDGDDYAPTAAACTGGPLPKTDCDDADAMDNPGMPERCGGGDNDCDGMADEEPAATSTCTAASATSECVAGACRILACTPGTADCDASYANGCEVTLGTSASHCGGCGNACGLASTCSSSQCDGIVSVQVGSSFSCALRSNGRVVCWGDNQFGQLGDPAVMVDSSTPVEVVGLTNVTQIAVGSSFACARRGDGTAWCWGRNFALELGIGSSSPTSSATPLQVAGVSPAATLTGVVEVTAGNEHACARLSASPWLVCWGEGGSGQLGRNSTVDSNRPVVVLGTATAELTNVSAVSAGYFHTCARRSVTPYVVCWGGNADGQVGDGTTMTRLRPVQVNTLGGLNTTTHIAVGTTHTCARTTGGLVYCWGDDFAGQVGNDVATTDVLSPAVVATVTAASDVWVGENHSCARTDTRVLYCWGSNTYGQIGDGTMIQRNTPVVSRTDDQLVPGDGGNGHSCVLRSSGQVSCWGQNDEGQLGDGSTTQRTTPVVTINLGRMTQISGGGQHTCVRRDSGEVACWGYDYQGRLGNGAGVTSTVRPTGHWSLADVVEVSIGRGHSCARRASGAVACWGDNPEGQTGDGTIRAPVYTSTPVTGITDAISLGAGSDHTCVARTGGGVSCWGLNMQGQIGDGTTMVRAAPVAVSGITTAAEVVGGEHHSCARLRTGEVWCWGDDAFGQLGNNAALADSLTPVQVSGITSAVDLSAGTLHTCALLATGEIQCWGADSSQQLGNGATSTNQATPVTVTGTTTSMTDVVEIFGGGLHTCARRVTGQVVCWGSNDDGELGLGDTATRDVPTAVASVADGRAGTSGEDHTCVIRTTGQIACAGSDTQGQLGDGNASTADQTSMTPVVLMP